MTTKPILLLLESNTTGTGRLFPSAARALGLRPVVAVQDPSRFPYLAEDGVETLVVDTDDVDALASAVEAQLGPVKGVCTSTDRMLATAAKLAERWRIPGLRPEVVAKVQNKTAFREQLIASGFDAPKYGSAATREELLNLARQIGYPLVVKPSVGTGSIGVLRCNDESELLEYLESATGGVESLLIEEYLQGQEYSVESIDGEPIVVVGKHLGPEPFFVEVGHDVPAYLPQTERDRICAMVKDVLLALGATAGPSHTELRINGPRMTIIEINLRLAGGRIPMLVELAQGIDLIAHSVASAAGLSTAVQQRTDQAACIRWVIPSTEGKLTEFLGFSEAQAMPGVTAVGSTRQTGEAFGFEHSFRDRVAYVMAGGDNLALARRAAESAAELIQISVAAAVSPEGGR